MKAFFRSLVRRCVFMVLLLGQGALAAELPAGPWSEPEVLKAGLAIGMTEVQQPKFRDGVTAFFSCRVAALNRLLKARDNVDMDRKLRSKTNGCLRKMDQQMKDFLTEDQLPRYQVYRETLVQHLPGM